MLSVINRSLQPQLKTDDLLEISEAKGTLSRIPDSGTVVTLFLGLKNYRSLPEYR